MLAMRGFKARHRAKWHPRFNTPDSDIIVESSDLTLFGLHRKNLQAYTGAFPLPAAAETTTTTTPAPPKISLPEPASVLEILFKYLYPKLKQPHPDLGDLNLTELMAISDAVGKYQVFAAQHVCLIRLRAMTKDHPLEVFDHAVKYDFRSIIDEAAQHIVLYPVLGVLERLPANAFIPWLAYNEATWRAIFCLSKKILQDIKMMTPELGSVCAFDDTPNTQLAAYKKHLQDFKMMTAELGSVCAFDDTSTLLATTKCVNDAEVWVGYLENLSTFAKLEAQLQGLENNIYRGCGPSCGLMRCIEESFQQGLQEAKSIKFTSFYFIRGP